jgi:peptidoglycan-N-acetylglucosamine deacetylase
VLWSLWGKDWTARATPESIARLATGGAAAGDILLLHDADYYSARGSWTRTAAALPIILGELDGQGLKAVSLDRRDGGAVVH